VTGHKHVIFNGNEITALTNSGWKYNLPQVSAGEDIDGVEFLGMDNDATAANSRRGTAWPSVPAE
jgi:hypothetical protein